MDSNDFYTLYQTLQEILETQRQILAQLKAERDEKAKRNRRNIPLILSGDGI